MTVDYQTLPNGLRLALRRLTSPVEICGLAVDVGSRDESVGEEGLAHLVEHTISRAPTGDVRPTSTGAWKP